MGKETKSNPRASLIAGFIAGAMEAVSCWPMEYIKTQLQLATKLSPGEVPKYTGIIDGLIYTYRTHGFFALYRGLAPNLIGAMPKASIRFGANAKYQNMLRDKDGKLSGSGNFTAGALAGITEAVVCVTPLETLKVKLIQGNLPMVKGIQQIYNSEGLKGFYKGLSATIMKQASNQGLRFFWFNEYKKIVTSDGKKKMTPLLSLVGGMTAGIFSTLGNNPFDVVKTRMQALDASKYSGTMNCFYKILTQEGPKAYYKGCLARMGRVVPGQGIVFMSVEFIEQKIGKYFE
jgi:solute carrier family 25 citrate transporter 1